MDEELSPLTSAKSKNNPEALLTVLAGVLIASLYEFV